jgi:hypothetical protein
MWTYENNNPHFDCVGGPRVSGCVFHYAATERPQRQHELAWVSARPSAQLKQYDEQQLLIDHPRCPALDLPGVGRALFWDAQGMNG